MPNSLIKSPTPDKSTEAPTVTIAAEKVCSESHRYKNPSDRSCIARPRDLPSLTGLSRTTCWRLERA